MACYSQVDDSALPLPSFPDMFWQRPWPHRIIEGDSLSAVEQECLASLQQGEWTIMQNSDEQASFAGPGGLYPFAPYTVDRGSLLPLDSALYWSQWSEMALVPHTIYFDSAAHLIAMLSSTSMKELGEVSALQRLWHTRTKFEVLEFWRDLTTALIVGDRMERFKGG